MANLGDPMRSLIVQPLITPNELAADLPLSPAAAETIHNGRTAVARILAGADDRLLVIVGPCSTHDVDAGLSYAKSLLGIVDELAEDLFVVMRVYTEKPRTQLGWPGLVSDPHLDGSYDLARGLPLARSLMLEVAELGMPVATEWLSPVTPAYLADLVSWGAIGARTVESQVHRQLASGLPMPIGMKNSSTGSVAAAVDAVHAAAVPHAYLGMAQNGTPAILRSTGNPHCHIVLRGAAGRPNYRPAEVADTVAQLVAADLPTGIVIDASHGNSGKDHERQPVVAREIGTQIAAGTTEIRGLMLESFLIPGRQNFGDGKPVFGQSITDACMGWDTTTELLADLATAARHRRTGH